MMLAARVAASLLLAGWLADKLAAHDRDVERGVAAYEAADYETALQAFDAAVERRGDRPELQYDRGLVLLAQGDREGATSSFERASEADDSNVRASAHYELGNLALDAESWDEAVTHYIECLKAKPDHGNAKWNLELALERKRAEEEEQKKKEEEQKQEEEDSQDDGGEQNPEDGEQDPNAGEQDPEQREGEEPPPESDDEADPQQGDEESPKDEEPKEEPAQDDPSKPPEQGGEPQDESEEPQGTKDSATPVPIQQMDIDKALDELDQQDALMLDRPSGRVARPEKDW